MNNRVIFALCLPLALLALGCSANYHLRRACWKDPSICRTDTLVRIDTFHVPSVVHDTLMQLVHHDTVVIREGRSQVRYYYNTYSDSIWVEGQCDEEMIVRETHIPVPMIVPPPAWHGTSFWILVVALGVLMLGIVRLLTR